MSTDQRASVSWRTAPFALLAALLLCLVPAGTAHADTPAERIANGLRDTPVYVDPAFEQALPADRRRQLARKIEKSGLPVRIIVVPFIAGDSWGGEPDKMVNVVRDRLGEPDTKEAVYMTLSRYEGHLTGVEYPFEGRHEAASAVSAVGHQDDMKEASLYRKFFRALDIVREGNGDKVYAEATKPDRDERDRARADSADGGEESTGIGLVLLYGVLGLAALAAVLLGGRFLLRAARRRTTSSIRAPFSSPSSVFAAARETGERDLRARAQREVVALGEDLTAAGTAADPAALQRALDGYAAAGTVLDAARGVPDLAGALALVHESRQALERAARPAGKGRKKDKERARYGLPVCFFHPLHGPADTRIRWRPLGRRESLHVAACAECVRAVEAHRPPEVLTDTHEDRDLPYFEVPATHSLWAATGYGSLGDEPLTVRVGRGDFTRAQEAAQASG